MLFERVGKADCAVRIEFDVRGYHHIVGIVRLGDRNLLVGMFHPSGAPEGTPLEPTPCALMPLGEIREDPAFKPWFAVGVLYPTDAEAKAVVENGLLA